MVFSNSFELSCHFFRWSVDVKCTYFNWSSSRTQQTPNAFLLLVLQLSIFFSISYFVVSPKTSYFQYIILYSSHLLVSTIDPLLHSSMSPSRVSWCRRNFVQVVLTYVDTGYNTTLVNEKTENQRREVRKRRGRRG